MVGSNATTDVQKAKTFKAGYKVLLKRTRQTQPKFVRKCLIEDCLKLWTLVTFVIKRGSTLTITIGSSWTEMTLQTTKSNDLKANQAIPLKSPRTLST